MARKPDDQRTLDQAPAWPICGQRVWWYNNADDTRPPRMGFVQRCSDQGLVDMALPPSTDGDWATIICVPHISNEALVDVRGSPTTLAQKKGAWQFNPLDISAGSVPPKRRTNMVQNAPSPLSDPQLVAKVVALARDEKMDFGGVVREAQKWGFHKNDVRNIYDRHGLTQELGVFG